MGRTGKELFTGPNTPMCHSFLFTLGSGNFFSIIFFLSGVVWYKYSHPRPFHFFSFYVYSPDHFTRFHFKLEQAWISELFLQMAVVWYVISNYHSLFSTNKSKWLFNCWHFYATCRSFTDLGNRTHFCISKLRKVRQKGVTWQANDIFYAKNG